MQVDLQAGRDGVDQRVALFAVQAIQAVLRAGARQPGGSPCHFLVDAAGDAPPEFMPVQVAPPGVDCRMAGELRQHRVAFACHDGHEVGRNFNLCHFSTQNQENCVEI